MRLTHFLPLSLLLWLAAALGGCSTEGDFCTTADDCDDGQICARIAACPGGECSGICGIPCTSNADCSDDQVCDRFSADDVACLPRPEDE